MGDNVCLPCFLFMKKLTLPFNLNLSLGFGRIVIYIERIIV